MGHVLMNYRTRNHDNLDTVRLSAYIHTPCDEHSRWSLPHVAQHIPAHDSLVVGSLDKDIVRLVSVLLQLFLVIANAPNSVTFNRDHLNIRVSNLALWIATSALLAASHPVSVLSVMRTISVITENVSGPVLVGDSYYLNLLRCGITTFQYFVDTSSLKVSG